MSGRNKKQSPLQWLLSHGVGAAYSVILMLTVGIVKWTLIGILFFIAWIEHVR